MHIHFFEEYPTEENIKKLNLLPFDTTVYIAARSLNEFLQLQTKVQQVSPSTAVVYWPILEKSYWISPFSYTSELKQLYREVLSGKIETVLLDLELPLLKKYLFFKNSFSFFKNKQIIKQILRSAKHQNITVLTAEYSEFGNITYYVKRLFGIAYKQLLFEHTPVPMMYTSIVKSKLVLRLIKQNIKRTKPKYVGIGTITTGVLENEPLLTLKQLDVDLAFCKWCGIKTIIVFRLGGLTTEYVKMLTKHS